jgi:hypothetical protein
VHRAFPTAILSRPAVMFGPDDAFLTTLVKLIRLLPIYPMFGTGRTKLQPVYVEDVAEATTLLMERGGDAVDRCYEFGGPRVYAYEELVRALAVQTGARTKIVPMPFALWHALAWFAEHLPGSPLTRNQIALMRRDSGVPRSSWAPRAWYRARGDRPRGHTPAKIEEMTTLIGLISWPGEVRCLSTAQAPRMHSWMAGLRSPPSKRVSNQARGQWGKGSQVISVPKRHSPAMAKTNAQNPRSSA